MQLKRSRLRIPPLRHRILRETTHRKSVGNEGVRYLVIFRPRISIAQEKQWVQEVDELVGCMVDC